MRRMLFTLAAALSLVLFAATTGLWVRSYWVADIFRLPPAGQQFFLCSFNGRIISGIDPEAGGGRPPHQAEASGDFNGRSIYYFVHPELHDLWELLYLEVDAPAWVFMGAFGVLPVVWLCRQREWLLLRKAARSRSGRCVECGYDLRATPRRCPECGAVPTVVIHVPNHASGESDVAAC